MNPFFTIIIPLTEKLAYLFPFTLDGLTLQKEAPSFEVIIVDGSHGKVPLHHLSLENVKILQTHTSNLFAMINQALPLAQGNYIHCLGPGEFYMSQTALSFVMKMIQAYEFPDLVTTAWIVRHHFGQPTVKISPLEMEDLKNGQIHPSLHPFWFRKETLVMLGGFSEKYQIQGGYDLLVRFFEAPTLRKTFVKRVLTDYEYRKPPSKWILIQCLETFKVYFRYFGPTYYLFLWLLKNYLRLMRFFWITARAAFLKGGS